MLIKKLLPILAMTIFILNSCYKEDLNAELYHGSKKKTFAERKTDTTIDANTNTGLNGRSISVNNFGLGSTR
jgi:hypothetical protein